MLRIGIKRSVQVRSLHTSVRLFDRPPTFTTPEQSPPPPPLSHPTPSPNSSTNSITSDKHAPLPPLPPTNLPVEDYASPLLHTASFFSQLFRYAVYGSVGIVSIAVASMISLHLYIEHVQLAAPPELSRNQDPDEWLLEQEGWTGLHTGKGGTDPRLGLLARAAVRGAWISQNWGGGKAVSPLTAHQPTFGVTPRMIGQDKLQESRGTMVGDSGWLMAEQYLVYAMRKAEERGIALVEPGDWEKQIEVGGVDRAAVELEERLAGLRERIGGRIKLELARDGWERIYLALVTSPTTDRSTPEKNKLVEWEQRERVTASRKLGELGARIAELWGKDSEEGQHEIQRAQQWFVGGLAPILSGSTSPSLQIATSQPQQTEKHVSPSSSFFSFWSRSHPPTTTSTISTPPAPSTHSLSSLISQIPSFSPTSPATSRAILSSLVSLETFLARTASDLPSAKSLQSSAISLAQTLQQSSHQPPSSLSSPDQLLPPSTTANASKLLTSLYLTTRISALQTHLSECSLALLQSQRSRSLPTARQSTLRELHSVREAVQSVLLTLPKSEKEEEMVFAKQVVGDKKVKAVLEEQSRRIRRDAEKVEKIAEGLIGYLEGNVAGKKK